MRQRLRRLRGGVVRVTDAARLLVLFVAGVWVQAVPVRKIRWSVAKGAKCSICARVSDGLTYKATGAVLCFDCSTDAFRLVGEAFDRHQKRVN